MAAIQKGRHFSLYLSLPKWFLSKLNVFLNLNLNGMKATIGVYKDHDTALEAVADLKEAGFPVKHISIIGLAETEVVDNDLHVSPKNPLKMGGVAAGTALGTTVGILTGAGLFAIPGLGFVFGAGAVIGAIAGFDFGLIGGGIASLFMTLGVHEEAAKKYHKELEEGKYIVLAQGSPENVQHAMDILTKNNTHTILEAH